MIIIERRWLSVYFFISHAAGVVYIRGMIPLNYDAAYAQFSISYS